MHEIVSLGHPKSKVSRMESIQEISKDIKAHLQERLSNPFAIVFLVSWILWNFKFLLILFSDVDLQDKFILMDLHFQTVNQILYSYRIDYSGYLFNAFCAPLTLTLIYVFLSPILSLPTYIFSLFIKTKMINAKKKNESDELMTREDARRLRLKYSEMKLSFEKYLDDANQQIETLSQELNNQASIQNELTTIDEGEVDLADYEVDKVLNTHFNAKFDDVDEVQHEILSIFAKSGGDRELESDIISELTPLNEHIIKKSLEELIHKRWLTSNGTTVTQRRAYRITPKAREYIVEKIL